MGDTVDIEEREIEYRKNMFHEVILALVEVIKIKDRLDGRALHHLAYVLEGVVVQFQREYGQGN